MDLQIIPVLLLEKHLQQFPKEVMDAFNALHEADISTDRFSFYTSVASVFSSKIEGEQIELDSYIKHKKFGVEFLPDYTRKIDDLYDAYTLAKTNALNEKNIVQAHKLSTKHILTAHQQGQLRTGNMFVTTPDGKIEYVAATPEEVKGEMEKFYADINVLLTRQMDLPEVFFFAAMLHLVFVKIHPWNDGNGRSARLIEKWFLAQKLGDKAWIVQSEKYYYENHATYYNNIRLLGLEYPSLDYAKAMKFLMMLAESMIVT